MGVDTVVTPYQVLKELTPEDGDSIVTLYQCLPRGHIYGDALARGLHAHLIGKISSFKVTTEISSVPKTQLPQRDFDQLELGSSYRIHTPVDPFFTKGVEFLVRKLPGEWCHVGWLATINPVDRQSITFDAKRLLDFEGAFCLEEGTELGVRVVNNGGGYLQHQDKIIIWGAIAEELTITCLDKQDPISGSTTIVPEFKLDHIVGDVKIFYIEYPGALKLIDGKIWHNQVVGQTVGNAGTGAYIEGESALAYYELLWNAIANEVAGGRGASAQQDFFDNKVITIKDTHNIRESLVYTGLSDGYT